MDSSPSLNHLDLKNVLLAKVSLNALITIVSPIFTNFMPLENSYFLAILLTP